MKLDDLKIILKGAVGSMTLGIYHMYILQILLMKIIEMINLE